MSSLRLIIAIDGTTSTAGGSFDAVAGTVNGILTSVKKIHDMVHIGTVPGTNFQQSSHYFQGVGTAGVDENIDSDRLHLVVRARASFEGTTGSGYVAILRSAYKVCCENVAGPNDEIWMFGYSRGGFIIRALASLLEHVGLIKPEEMITERAFRRRFGQQLQRYSMLTSVNRIVSIRRGFLLPFAVESPPIRFMGAFDSIKAIFPMPITNMLAHGIPFLDFDEDAPRLVQHFRHVLSLTEQRPHFAPSLWKTPADPSNVSSSYLEAWFFGFHADVGGGSPERGLTIWPLQWMLSSATELGLALSIPTDELFPHPAHSINIPHQPRMTMHDVLPQLAATPFRPIMHATTPRQQLQPRNYRSTLTSPPYTDRRAARVFLHPSTYMLFNTHAAFRLQVYTWRWFREFLQDYPRALPGGTAPWWEGQTEATMLQVVVPVRRLRLLVYGAASAEKTALVEVAFGHGEARRGGEECRDGEETGDAGLQYHSDGMVACETQTLEHAVNFVAKHVQKTDADEKLHAIWFCIDLMTGPVTDEDRRFTSTHFGDIPVIVVLTRADAKRAQIYEELIATGVTVTDEAIEERMEAVVAAKQAELPNLATRTFVPVDSSPEAIEQLLMITSQQLTDPRVLAAEVRAQRTSPRLKLSLAADAATHAYAVWRAFAFTGAEHVFQQHAGAASVLSDVLVLAVLDCFNMRVPGDAETIRDRLGAPWVSALAPFPATLLDRGIPPAALLCCMLDTMVVVTRAMARRGGVTPAGIEAACAWYKLRQPDVHARVAGLLAADGAPRDGSLAVVQLLFAEAVEGALGGGGWSIGGVVGGTVGVGKAAWRVAAAGLLGAVTIGSGIVFGVGNELRRGVMG